MLVRIDEAITAKAGMFGVSKETMIDAVLKVPTLMSRDIKKLKHRVKIIVRIAARQGQLAPADILKQWPQA